MLPRSPVLFDSNGNSYTDCTQSDMCVCVCIYIYIYIHIYVYISDTVQTVYELPLLPNNTGLKHSYNKSERCEVLTGYLALGRRSGGDWVNT